MLQVVKPSLEKKSSLLRLKPKLPTRIFFLKTHLAYGRVSFVSMLYHMQDFTLAVPHPELKCNLLGSD